MIICLQFIFEYQNMSLARKGSKPTLRLTVEDFTACMDQKNGVITSLQCELESLRTNQEKFDRVKEQLAKARARYEALLRDHQTKIGNNQERLELSVRSVYELRIQAEQLGDELKIKMSSLKEAKFGGQQLADFYNQKEDETSEIKFKLQQQRSIGDVKAMEQERTRLQAAQVREEVEKGKRENQLIRTQAESVNEKYYKTQSYIRSLLREQTNLTESLTKIQEENSILDANISELDTVLSINQSEISNKEKDCQELEYHIASKELEKRKTENEIREKVKQLTAEKEKWRALCEQWEQAKFDATRLENLINFIISKNNEISEVNEQLKDDLKVCERHLDNVARVNKSMEVEIKELHDTNIKAISKLREPFSSRAPTNQGQYTEKWGAASRATDFETGDFDRACWK